MTELQLQNFLGTLVPEFFFFSLFIVIAFVVLGLASLWVLCYMINTIARVLLQVRAFRRLKRLKNARNVNSLP